MNTQKLSQMKVNDIKKQGSTSNYLNALCKEKPLMVISMKIAM